MWIDRLVRLLLPRQDRFFTLLEELAGRMTAAAAVFGELADAAGRDRLAALAGRLKPIETEADRVCHRVYEELDRTFVTPIDREDLGQLTKALDNVIDGMEDTIPMGLVAAAGKKAEELAGAAAAAKFEDLHRGGWDPKARIADRVQSDEVFERMRAAVRERETIERDGEPRFAEGLHGFGLAQDP